MRPTSTRSFRRMLRIATAALAALFLSAGVFAPTADAHGKPKKHYKQHHRAHRHEQRHAHFVVPRRIPEGHFVRYEPYRAGRIWYAPHRHSHAVYHFPVVTEYGVSYAPHAYCGDALYTTGHLAVAGPRFGLYIGF